MALRRDLATTIASALALLAATSFPAFAENCGKGVSEMVASSGEGRLFVATQRNCSSPSCLQAVSADNGVLRRGQIYQFFASTKQSSVQNSVVGIQVEGIAERATGPTKVGLSREHLAFACKGVWPWRTVGSEEEYPAPDEPADEVSYSNFDYYHRRTPQGTTPEFRRMRDRFHVRYQNGRECVRSDDNNRRYLLLFRERESFTKDPVTAFANQLNIPGFSDNAAQAAPGTIQPAARFNVRLVTYRKQGGTSGCFAFPVNTHGLREVHITLRDLEELQSASRDERYYPESWNFVVK